MLGLDKQSRLNRKLRHAAATVNIVGIKKALQVGVDLEANLQLGGQP